MIDWIHPGIIFILGAILVPFLKGRTRQAYLVLVPALAILAVASMSHGTYGTFTIIGRELILGKVDKLSVVFGYVFSIAALISTIYALHVEKPGEHVAAFLYVGSSLGVVFAGDYFTLFIFWEVMAFASCYLVFVQRNKQAVDSAFRYLMVHIAGGLFLLGGIILHYIDTGSILFGPIAHDGSLAFYLILIGFILNAAVPPLNAWLTDAYPEATVTGAVFMSAFTTKTAVYVLIRAFPGTELLVVLGVIMALYGVVYAVMENDARRLLAYHIVSQVGYMVAGVGMGTEMTLNGSTAHAFAHILYKGLLFMGAGAVIYMTGIRKLTELGGLYKTMPITVVLYMVGAFAISAFPLFSGFVSKSMVIAGASHDHRPFVTLLLTMASSGTFLHTGLKLPYYMFFGKDSGIRVKEPPRNMLIAMGMAAFLCIAIGVFPGPLYNLLPYPVHFEPYTADHVTGALSILMFTALGFFLLLKYLDPEPTVSVDTDWFYRKGAAVFMRIARGPVVIYENFVSNLSNTAVLKPLYLVAGICHKIDIHIVDGAVNGVANLVIACGARMRRIQTGLVQHYALGIIVGLLVIIAIYAIR
ncbi:MAG: Na(+)/H(+) antiporter subunit D [Deltaproteobacteria bacterium]|nr:Na(+)/H(+) antiporter subunit D [Deltaproteobacteria bacterium]